MALYDFLRESFSYRGLYRKLRLVEKTIVPEKVSFGVDPNQYFLYYEPKRLASDKVIVWVHGGGWNAGSPEDFDFVGQCAAKEGFRFVSLGYRLSPKHKYPCQIEDVCDGFTTALVHLKRKGIETTQIVVSGPSAGAHLASILCYSKTVQKEYGVDPSSIIGFIGAGGPYSFSGKQSFTVRILLDQLFSKGYDRTQAEPCALMSHNHIPMLLIQSRHDGLIEYDCAERFCEKAPVWAIGVNCIPSRIKRIHIPGIRRGCSSKPERKTAVWIVFLPGSRICDNWPIQLPSGLAVSKKIWYTESIPCGLVLRERSPIHAAGNCNRSGLWRSV